MGAAFGFKTTSAVLELDTITLDLLFPLGLHRFKLGLIRRQLVFPGDQAGGPLLQFPQRIDLITSDGSKAIELRFDVLEYSKDIIAR